MNLTPREKDKLLVSLAAMVARSRLARGVKLNHPEAIALITDYVVEGARDGRTVADLMEAGAHVVAREPVHGGGAGDDPRRAGRGDLPGRDQARHRPSADPVERETTCGASSTSSRSLAPDRGAGAYRHRRRTGRRSPRASRIRCSGPTTSWRCWRSGCFAGDDRRAGAVGLSGGVRRGDGARRGARGRVARCCRWWSRRSSPRWWCWGRRSPSRCGRRSRLACAVIAVFGMAHGTAHGLEAPALGGAALRPRASCSSTAALHPRPGWRFGVGAAAGGRRGRWARLAGVAGVALMLA